MPVRRRPPGTSIECRGCPTELSVCFSERNSSPDRVYASRFSRIRDCARIGRASPSAWHVGSVPYAERASGARRWTSKVLRRSLRKLRDSFETRTKLVHGVCGAILAFAAPGTKYGRGHEPNFALVRCKRAGHSLVPRGSVTSRFSVTMVSVLERRVADRLARRLRTMRGSRLEACENREERRRLRCAFWAQYTRERRTYMGGDRQKTRRNRSLRCDSRRYSSLFHRFYTALPRVGVERPNGSYVARTHRCWPRELPSFVDERESDVSSRAYRTSTPRMRATEGEILSVCTCNP